MSVYKEVIKENFLTVGIEYPGSEWVLQKKKRKKRREAHQMQGFEKESGRIEMIE